MAALFVGGAGCGSSSGSSGSTASCTLVSSGAKWVPRISGADASHHDSSITETKVVQTRQWAPGRSRRGRPGRRGDLRQHRHDRGPGRIGLAHAPGGSGQRALEYPGQRLSHPRFPQRRHQRIHQAPACRRVGRLLERGLFQLPERQLHAERGLQGADGADRVLRLPTLERPHVRRQRQRLGRHVPDLQLDGVVGSEHGVRVQIPPSSPPWAAPRACGTA